MACSGSCLSLPPAPLEMHAICSKPLSEICSDMHVLLLEAVLMCLADPVEDSLHMAERTR